MENTRNHRLSLILLLALTGAAGCGMFPDNSKEYQEAEAMPDLEIPPDLTKDGISDRMAIPGEANRPGSSTSGQVPPPPE